MKNNAFTEIDFDKDNNKFWLGISSEIEYPDGTETRKSGFIKMKPKGIYLRFWIRKKVLILSSSNYFEIKTKPRSNFKLVLGMAGVLQK